MCLLDSHGPLLDTGKQMDDQLPAHEYTNNYGPDFRLHIPVRTGKENLNSPERLARLRDALLENISRYADSHDASCLGHACLAKNRRC